VFNNNKAYAGGAIFVADMTTSITSSNFTENSVLGPGSQGYVASGGAVYARGSGRLDVTNSNFINNSASGAGAAGGAIRIDVTQRYLDPETITGCTFTDNTAEDEGNAILNTGYASLTGNTIKESVAADDAAIYNTAGSWIALSQNTIECENGIETAGSVYCPGFKVIVNDNIKYIEAEYYDTVHIDMKFVDDNNNTIRVNGTGKTIRFGYSTMDYIRLSYNETSSLFEGDYIVKSKGNFGITYLDDLKQFFPYAAASDGRNLLYINATKIDPTLEVKYENVSQPDGVVINITLTGKEGAPAISTSNTYKFLVTVNDEPHTVQITRGVGNLTISELPVGKYVINASWGGNIQYNGVEQLYDLLVTPMKGTYSDLQYQIDNTQENGVMDLKYDFAFNEGYDDATEFANGILIDKNITVNGNGFAVDADKKFRILNIADGIAVTINNLTFKNGFASQGAAIYTAADSLTIHASNFIGNDPDQGGAIYIKEGNVTLDEGSVFENNTADYGGAIFVNYTATLNLKEVSFVNNTANVQGGAIYVENVGSPLNIGGSLIAENTNFTYNNAVNANAQGGAVYLKAYASLNLTNCIFEGNNANGTSTNAKGGAFHKLQVSCIY
jgi:predicted outer membrane repeat protein